MASSTTQTKTPSIMVILSRHSVLFLCLACSLYWLRRYRRKKLYPSPPTIRGWPIVGNAFQIPLTFVHLFYQDLGRKLGSKILYMEALGRPIIVINDAQIASDLIEKRSTIYSSRTKSPMLIDVIGTNHNFALFPYGEEWRIPRRFFTRHFATKTTPRELDTILHFIRKGLLSNLYQTPQAFKEHAEGCIGGISLSMTYGLPVQRNHDPLVRKSAESFSMVVAAASPGKYLVNVIPALKYVPKWFPGAGFKRRAPTMLAHRLEVLNEPFEATLKLMDNGTAPECFVASSLESQREKADFETTDRHVRNAASTIFGAATETTANSLVIFILAMLKNPDIQRKVQQEIDSVVGSDRLPDFDDQERLPYLAATLKESLRWNPVAPIAVPHATSEEDTYQGYYIPKGATVIVNTYAILQDEERFPNPKEFKPERFIKDGVLLTDVLDPFVVGTFGYGRRMCPGSHVALSILYLATASILSLFDISPEIDAKGNPINVIPKFNNASLASEPLPFPCKITPRKGKNVEGLLQEFLGFDVL